jgi:hypothetical protein
MSRCDQRSTITDVNKWSYTPQHNYYYYYYYLPLARDSVSRYLLIIKKIVLRTYKYYLLISTVHRDAKCKKVADVSEECTAATGSNIASDLDYQQHVCECLKSRTQGITQFL